MVRITATVCSLVFAALFVWVAVWTFTEPEPLVVPTNGVIRGASNDPLPTGPEAREALARRTQLQRWRADSGPSPEGGNTTGLSTSGAPMPARPARGAEGEAATRQWLAEKQNDWGVLIDRGYTAGAASLPSARDSVLIQPQGRDFRRLQQGNIAYAGGWIIFGMSLLLSVFLLIRGRVRLAHGFSGKEIERFDALERVTHWMTAASFIFLAITGLILIYGWSLLQPLMGSSAYGAMAQWNLYIHIAAAAPFIIGIGMMAMLWLRQNLPSKLDIEWLKRFGGFLNDSPDNPPARRFNAGQKLVFWGVVLGGLLMFVSGFTLMFPFYWTDIIALQWMLLGHALLAVLMVALILGHIYIGTIGMEGAFDAMWSGKVDRNWAEEHHELWVDEIGRKRKRGRAAQVPAE